MAENEESSMKALQTVSMAIGATRPVDTLVDEFSAPSASLEYGLHVICRTSIEITSRIEEGYAWRLFGRISTTTV